MTSEGIDHVIWCDSYLLGWDNTEAQSVLYLEVLLSEEHHGYRQFDKKSEHGCYRLARLFFSSQAKLSGLPNSKRDPIWDEGLGEFKDASEIISFELRSNGIVIVTDDFSVQATANGVVLDLVEDEGSKTFP